MSPSQPLPPKESTLFKKILKCYEHKQYKNGLKFAKTILSNPKFAEHGETLAMKGLTLNCLGRKDEAYEYVRRGLKNDLRSHVCWHVYGLLQRSDHKYDEAIKAYRNALKWDKDNIQILRDLSLLQIQMRDLEGYRDTRHQLFQLRPTQRVSWIGYAMAYHLIRDYEMAIKLLEEFRKTTQSQKQQSAAAHGANSKAASTSEQYETSELLLYQAQVYKEAGSHKEALDHLNKHMEEIMDRLAVHEMKTELLLALGRNKEAARLIRDHLIARNPENRQYYRLLEAALDLGSAREELRLRQYRELQETYPRAQVPKRIPLSFVNDPASFRELVADYLKKSLHKGQAALFRDFKPIYLSLCGSPLVHRCWENKPLPTKLQIIQDLMLGYHHNLKTNQSFEAAEATRDSEDRTTLLWVNYYLAQHFDFLNQHQRALDYVNEAIKHTPTLIELYVVKAKIFKHAGCIDEGVQCMEEAQSLDTADRYLNSKCAKYLLRANKVLESEDMCAKFTREGISAAENLNEMQCMWFQTEAAYAYRRMQKWGEALKKCVEIERHFAEITEDQFDFHTYCMRKMTLRAYVSLLRLEDVLKSHPFYFYAAKIAIEVYLRLHDRPLGPESVLQDLADSNVSASELKKLRNKQRKAEKKATAAEQQQQQQNQSQNNPHQHEKNADKDAASEPAVEKLVPAKLERPESALEEAIRFLRPLQTLAAERLDTHLLAFEIYYRRDKLMLMLQSLKRAHRISPGDAHLNRQLVLFKAKFEQRQGSLPDAVSKVIELELTKIIGGDRLTPLELNERFLTRNAHSLKHRFECAKAMALLSGNNDQARRNAANVLLAQNFDDLSDVSLELCLSLEQTLAQGELFGELADATKEQLKAQCHRLYPMAMAFYSKDQLAQLAQTNQQQQQQQYEPVAAIM